MTATYKESVEKTSTSRHKPRNTGIVANFQEEQLCNFVTKMYKCIIVESQTENEKNLAKTLKNLRKY